MRGCYLGPGRTAQDLEHVVRTDEQYHHRYVDQGVQSPVDGRNLRARLGDEAHVAHQDRHLGPRDHQTYEARDQDHQYQEQVQQNPAPPARRQPLPPPPPRPLAVRQDLLQLRVRGGGRRRGTERARVPHRHPAGRSRRRRLRLGPRGLPLEHRHVRPLRAVLVRDVDGAHALVAAVALAPRDRLGRLPADEVDDVVRDQRAVARTRGAVHVVGELGRLPGGAAEQLGRWRREDG